MLTPDQFIARWQEEVATKITGDEGLVTAPPELVAACPLTEQTRRFLIEAGLPKSCAPCLTFDELADGLQRLWDVYSPGQWAPNEKLELEHYGLIGSDSSGNPICVDERDGRVVLLDHELLFDVRHRESRIMLVNSSVCQLAESLLAVNSLPSAVRPEALERIDEPAMAKGTFWFDEALDLPDNANCGAGIQIRPWWKFW
jgi:hypothetical protein